MQNIYNARGKAEELINFSACMDELFINFKSAIQKDGRLEILPGIVFLYDFREQTSAVEYDKELARNSGANSETLSLMWDWEWSSTTPLEDDDDDYPDDQDDDEPYRSNPRLYSAFHSD